ncbi:PHP domain-containing protein [Nocardia farcinica]|uniref:PHP domain-containing protein n=1 Tax=Nocardia farcinica TaxID=37329 RepID=UPI002455BF64|nr:PHP domain-containing protein [Nocardia farcinica]
MTNTPSDFHVHSEWSWDTTSGHMESSCARAEALGLPSIAFTEHADFTPWTITPETYARLSPRYQQMVTPDNLLLPPIFDVGGYMQAIDRCRTSFPDLKIHTGIELGEPNIHVTATRDVLSQGEFDRILASSHSIDVSGEYHMVADCFRNESAEQILRTYLIGLVEMVQRDNTFQVLAHIDYPVRSWPTETEGPYTPEDYQEEFREVLKALASTDRVLEINTTVPLHPEIVTWWRDVGGQAVSFGSDAHSPDEIARNFEIAAAMAEAAGFKPRRDNPHDFWVRQK